MEYVNITVPPFPTFICAGKALYRQGDLHGARSYGIDCFDLIIVEKGMLYLNVDGTEYALKENSMLLIPEKMTHHGYKICPEETFFHWLHFTTHAPTHVSNQPVIYVPQKKIVGNMTYTSSCHTISIPIFQNIAQKKALEIFDIFRQLETVSHSRFEKNTIWIKHTLSTFKQQELLMRVFNEISLLPNENTKNSMSHIVMEYIESHYRENITLSDLSNLVNCHPTHLIRCIKKQFDRTPMQIVNEKRLQHGCDILCYTNDSITNIAYDLGFASSSYFCKQFKQLYGISPNQYRKENYKSVTR